MPFDPHASRARFAGLSATETCLDNAGGSFTLRAVIDRVAEYMATTPVQLGGLYPSAELAGARQRAATEAAARLVNCAPGEVLFGPSSTELLDRLARAMRSRFQPGDEVIVTDCDHEANIGPWRRLAVFGVVVREWRVDQRRHALDLAGLDALLTPRTKLVAVTHASNILGAIEPVAEIARRAHAVGAQVVVDGVAWAPHRAVDVQALGADYYVFSWYKVFGPHLGFMYGRRELLLGLDNINHAHLGKDALPYKLTPGGNCYELVHGTGAVVEYLEEIGAGLGAPATGRARLDAAFAAFAAHEQALAVRLLEYLESRGDVTLYGDWRADAAVRLPIIAFTLRGRRCQEVAAALGARGIGIKHGNFHAKRLTDAYGLDASDGLLRASFAHYNTPEECERLIEGLAAVAPVR
jgi:cysteine desulfurase family protein (TIGR01976 family)